MEEDLSALMKSKEIFNQEDSSSVTKRLNKFSINSTKMEMDLSDIVNSLVKLSQRAQPEEDEHDVMSTSSIIL